MTTQPDNEATETIISESTSEEERRIRVYDAKGDFVIAVPAGAKVTFGYFNPSAAGADTRRDAWGDAATGRNTFKTTALRIYERGEKGNQLAAFLGVSGFRDERIKLTRLSERVVIEQKVTNDGEGLIEWDGKKQHELVASREPDTYS